MTYSLQDIIDATEELVYQLNSWCDYEHGYDDYYFEIQQWRNDLIATLHE